MVGEMDESEEDMNSDIIEVDCALHDDNEVATKLGQKGVLSFEDLDESDFDSPQLLRVNSSASEAESILSIPADQLKVKFDIIDSKTKQDGRRKFTVYSIIVMEAPKLDIDGAVIERRYSDFSSLHAGLKKECPELTKRLAFPKKEFFGNFNPAVVETRSRKFEKYLRFIYHQPRVKETNSFREFFYVQHLREAAICFRCEDYDECYSQYKLGLTLQKKLDDEVREIIPTMCGLVEVCKVTKRQIEGETLATQALDLIGFDLHCPYLIPLIITTIDLRRALKIDSSWLSKKLTECERKSDVDRETCPSLRELAVKRF